MALSTAPRPRATSQRKPLSAARVYQAWSADVSQHGRRGSFRRVSELVGCTPEYIRQLVAKHEAAHTLKPELFTIHELDYLPAPGETPLARPVARPSDATPQTSNATADSCQTLCQADSVLNVNTCETGETQQLATDTQLQVAERENDVLPLADLPTAPPLLGVPSAAPLPTATVKRSAPRRPARHGVDIAQLVDVLTYQIGPVPVAAVVAFLLLVLLVLASQHG